jgi:hypothetical protein
LSGRRETGVIAPISSIKNTHNPNELYGEKTQYIIAYYLLNTKWMEKSSLLVL